MRKGATIGLTLRKKLAVPVPEAEGYGTDYTRAMPYGSCRSATYDAGPLSPESPATIVISVARLLMPVLGLWLIYRGLR